MTRVPCLRDVESGFSLVELLVALLLLLLVTSAIFALANPAAQASLTQPEAVDLQQRMRTATDALFRDLSTAGAGVDRGGNAGSLGDFVAPVVPRRLGLQSPDGPAVARSDVVTMIRLSAPWVQTSVRVPMPPGASALQVENAPGCPFTSLVCGFETGMTALVFDRTGAFDLFTIADVQLDVLSLAAHGSSGSGYGSDASAAQAEARTYYHDAATRQLRHYDGYLTDTPVLDDVVGVSFAYFGDPQPPDKPPPPPGVSNCLYDAGGNPVGGLATLTPEGGSLAPLPLALFTDGPWCGAGPNRFDADLLRIRRIRVTVHVQAAQAAFRAAGSDFANAGFSSGVYRYLPDQILTFDVSPRNLNLGR